MPTIDEPIGSADDAQQRWENTFGAFRDPQILAGLTQAQQAIDHAYLEFLQGHEGGIDVRCDEPDCDYEAVVAVFCRHTGPNLLMAIICGSHHQLIVGRRALTCHLCHHTGKPTDLWRFQFIFTGSDRRG